LVTSVIKTKHTDRDKGGGGVTECQYRTDQIWITGCVEFEKANENIELSSFSVVAFFLQGPDSFCTPSTVPATLGQERLLRDYYRNKIR